MYEAKDEFKAFAKSKTFIGRKLRFYATIQKEHYNEFTLCRCVQ